jgi:hypothetical protein
MVNVMDVEQEIKDLKKQVSDLDFRTKINERDIQAITAKLDKIEGNTSKIMWLIITAVVLALLNTIIKGGILS